MSYAPTGSLETTSGHSGRKLLGIALCTICRTLGLLFPSGFLVELLSRTLDPACIKPLEPRLGVCDSSIARPVCEPNGIATEYGKFPDAPVSTVELYHRRRHTRALKPLVGLFDCYRRSQRGKIFRISRAVDVVFRFDLTLLKHGDFVCAVNDVQQFRQVYKRSMRLLAERTLERERY